MGQARGCGEPVGGIIIGRGFFYREITVKCGGTDPHGGQYLCEKCEKLPDPAYCSVCGDYVGDPFGPDYICRCG